MKGWCGIFRRCVEYYQELGNWLRTFTVMRLRHRVLASASAAALALLMPCVAFAAPIMTRRAVVSRSSAAITFPAAAALPAAANGVASPDGTPPAAVEELLGRIPCYFVTSSQGEPYLTEVDDNGRRYGYAFLGPRDAAKVLNDVRVFDQRAVLAVVPLAAVYLELSKTAADADAARAAAPQPRTSTSTDMRLFQLMPLSDETHNFDAVSMVPGATLLPGVNLYYEPDLYIGADAGSRMRPYAFRLQDLKTVWRQGGGDNRNEGQQISPSLRVLSLQALIRMASDGTLTVPPLLLPPSETAALDYTASATPSPTETSEQSQQAPRRRTRTSALKMLAEPCCGRRTLSATGLAAVVGVAASALPARATAADNALSEILARFDDPSPRQWSAGMVDAVASSFSKEDRLVFPPWMESEWEVTSRPLATAAPLGRRFLPSDLASMRLGDLRSVEVPPLTYKVRFARRGGDGAIVSDRCNNLKAVQDASAGYARVDAVRFEDGSRLKVSYSPFGRNNTYPGPSRAEIYVNWRRQASPRADAQTFAFAEATRTVVLAQQRSVTVTDAETLCRFEQRSPSAVVATQRVLRYLTPNPNNAEGILWQEAQNRAVAVLDYELLLERVRPTAPPVCDVL